VRRGGWREFQIEGPACRQPQSMTDMNTADHVAGIIKVCFSFVICAHSPHSPSSAHRDSQDLLFTASSQLLHLSNCSSVSPFSFIVYIFQLPFSFIVYIFQLTRGQTCDDRPQSPYIFSHLLIQS